MPKSLLPEDEERRLALYREGKTDAECARAIGIRGHNFANWRRRRGLPANGFNGAGNKTVSVKLGYTAELRRDNARLREQLRLLRELVDEALATPAPDLQAAAPTAPAGEVEAK
jgi:transposase-like protein